LTDDQGEEETKIEVMREDDQQHRIKIDKEEMTEAKEGKSQIHKNRKEEKAARLF
jgi:hypothetical protein